MIGQTLGHYRIVAMIGAGGMGEVYRAHDKQLDRDVALKVLPACTLADEASRKRFRKEALALAKLNHPNIETVHEFSSQDGVDFLVMELIPGHSLTQKIREGSLPEREIVRLGIQFAEGLAAAHEQGVVHRDLNPSNLMITSGGRLKILDFGLAQLVYTSADPDMTRSITQETATVVGTVPYMAPEQLRGEPVDPRVDIYAAGAVLYEMATGKRAFPDTQPNRLIDSILHEVPPSPRTLNPRISPGLEAIIQRAIEKKAASRYQTARELLSTLEGLSLGARPTLTSNAPSSSLAVKGAGVFLIVLLLGLAFGLDLGGLRDRLLDRGSTKHGVPVSPSSPMRARPSVAVLTIKNVSGRQDEAWLSTALSEMLTTELAAGEQLRTVPGENIAQMKINLSLPDADSYGRDTLQKIHKNLNADNVVVGSYIPLGKGQIRLDLRLQDAVQGETLAAVSEKGSEDEIDDLINRAGLKLRAKLGVGAVSEATAVAAKATLPSNPEAARLYSEGLAKLRSFDNVAARNLLQKAVTVAPNFALAHSALARALKGLGYDPKAQEEAKKAFDLSGILGREERLSIEGQYREMAYEWDKAVEIYRTLFQFFPDNLDYGILLANAETRAGKGKEALATVESLRRLPTQVGKDARIDLAAAEASYFLGDFELAQSFAASAAQNAEAAGARLIVARALYRQSSAFQKLGEREEAMAASEKARAIYAAAGDGNGVASALEVKAQVQTDKGDLRGAIASYNKELAIVREVGNKRAESSALNNLASVLDQQGASTVARKMYEQAFVTFREIGDKNNSARALVNIGTILQDQGDLVGAKSIYEQALGVFHEVNDKDGIALALSELGSLFDAQGDFPLARKMIEQALAIDLENGRKTPSGDKIVVLGDLLQHEGDLAGAAKSYQDGLGISREAGDKSTAALALFGLGNLALEGADFGNAGKYFDEALELRNGLGEKKNVDATRVALAGLAIEQGHANQAATSLRELRAGLRKAKRSEDETTITCLLARALLAQGKFANARQELDGISALALNNQNIGTRLDFTIVSARVLAALGSPLPAKNSLDNAIAEATKAGFLKYEFEARLALAETEMKAGLAAEPSARLVELETDAKARGFVLIAHKAAAARGGEER
jgi:serine/threonine protein kinase/tetratricopeptide (TPR) repeat protein